VLTAGKAMLRGRQRLLGARPSALAKWLAKRETFAQITLNCVWHHEKVINGGPENIDSRVAGTPINMRLPTANLHNITQMTHAYSEPKKTKRMK